MLIVKTLQILRQHIRKLRQEDKRIALVPTMGNLHEGHIKLVNEAKARADTVIVSIFINPMQFDKIDDLILYPSSLQEDYKKLDQYHLDLVFSPKLTEIYPKGIKATTYVEVPIISNIVEGASRPGHFRGVSTIISKLFNLIQPDIACFGEKDFQQLALIRKMVADLDYDIDIVSVPTVRAKDGLALSSRNNYLNTSQRKISSNLNKVINEMTEQLKSKKMTIREIVSFGKQTLNCIGFRIEYLQILDADTLLEVTKISQRAVILSAVWLGRVRLIDNKVINLR